MGKQGLRDKDGMLGIIAAHTLPKNKTVPPLSVPPPLNAALGQPLCRQPERIADSGAKQQTGEAMGEFRRHFRRARKMY